MTWRDDALKRIAEIHATMPDASAEELRKELRKHSGSFSGGTSWGSKIWPSACRQYLAKHFGVPAVPQRYDWPADVCFPFRDEA